jgi:predicted membrane metal-binding protein
MTNPAALHEQLNRSEDVQGSSDRSFGITFAVVGAFFALWPLLDGEAPRWWLLAIAAALLAISVTAPHILRPLNRIWLTIGLLLNKIVSPIVLGVIFYLVLTPVGFLMRLAGKDALRLRFEKGARTYWILREPPGPAPKSMSRQF